MKYEEAKDYVSAIYLKYGENGTYVAVEINEGYTKKYVYPHKSLFDSIDNVAKDVDKSIKKALED